jgi:multiple sugar transport system permease protein/raffinose/stachyose/melibiose transport system permease protein
LVYTGIGTPFSVFLVTTYFRSFPDQLFEAARIDGASSLQILWEFVLPLARPVMFTIGILEFIIVWDDLLVAVLMVQNPSQRTFTTGLALISSGHFTSTPVLLAGSVVSVLPATIVFIVFQKYLVQGLTAGIER